MGQFFTIYCLEFAIILMLLIRNFFFLSIPFRQEQHLEPFKYNLKSSTTLGTGVISQPPWGRWWQNLCGIHLAEVQHVRLCTPELRAAAMEGCVWESCWAGCPQHCVSPEPSRSSVGMWQEADTLLSAAASRGGLRHGGHQSQAAPEPLQWLAIPAGLGRR